MTEVEKGIRVGNLDAPICVADKDRAKHAVSYLDAVIHILSFTCISQMCLL